MVYNVIISPEALQEIESAIDYYASNSIDAPKKFIVALNAIDPFRQQENKTVTFGSNYTLQSLSFTQTRNYRVALSYIFSKTPKTIFSYMKGKK